MPSGLQANIYSHLMRLRCFIRNFFENMFLLLSFIALKSYGIFLSHKFINNRTSLVFHNIILFRVSTGHFSLNLIEIRVQSNANIYYQIKLRHKNSIVYSVIWSPIYGSINASFNTMRAKLIAIKSIDRRIVACNLTTVALNFKICDTFRLAKLFFKVTFNSVFNIRLGCW